MIIFLPIKPKYAFGILSGEKKFEFRKTNFSKNVEKVIVYASSPYKKILGFFSVKAIHKLSPKESWKKFGDWGIIAKDEYFEYFDGKKTAISIEVDEVVKFNNHIEPRSMSLKVPQSYSYVHEEAFDDLVSCGQPA